MALIAAIALIHTMVVFTAWLKQRLQPMRRRFGFFNGSHSPTENSPLRSQQQNLVPPSMDLQLPRSSLLSNRSEVMAMTSFSAVPNSTRNSTITLEEDLSESEETSFLQPSSSLGARPKDRSKLVAVACPKVPDENAPAKNESGSLLSYVKTKYASFLQSKIVVKSSSSSDSEDDCVDLLVNFEPKLPFLVPINSEQLETFKRLSAAQKNLHSAEERLNLNQRRVDGLNAEYEVLHSQGGADAGRMDECLKSNYKV